MGGPRAKGNRPCFSNVRGLTLTDLLQTIYGDPPPIPKINNGLTPQLLAVSSIISSPVRVTHGLLHPVSRLDVRILVWLCIYAVYSVYVVAN